MSTQNARAITERDATVKLAVAVQLAGEAERTQSEALEFAHEFDTFIDQAHSSNLAVYMDVVAYLNRLDALSRTFEHKLNSVHTLARRLEIDHHIYEARDYIRILIDKINCERPLDRPRYLITTGHEVGVELSHTLRVMAWILYELSRTAWAMSEASRAALDSIHSSDVANRPGDVSRPAAGLLKVAIQIVPSANRERYREELLADLHDIASGKAPRLAQVRYSINQVLRAFPLRLSLRRPTYYARDIAFRLTYWLLSSDVRTWGFLGPLLAWGIVNIHLQQGWGSALFTLPGLVAFYAGIEWLRKRWRVK
ncbi:hypothetical protein ABGB17_34460 [Sphaerisporangium sp. B11E5]|uniref:hypothetical protein n=1 Tax=Sphaerisporangium sp. B11E5 TaxID=3153563 RepID=UPI00325F6E07